MVVKYYDDNIQKGEQNMNRDDLIGYIWDAYKDVNGVRPRWIDFDAMSDAELSEYADRIEQQVVESIDADKKREQEAAVKFEALVAHLISIGANNRETAIRWLLDEVGVGGKDALRWEYGLNWQYTI